MDLHKYKIEFDDDSEMFVLQGSDELRVIKKQDDIWIVEHENKIYHASIESFDISTKSYSIRVNGKKIKLRFKTKTDQLIEEMGLDQLSENDINRLEAPMPGLVLDVLVQIGDQIEEGQPLMILEAMKMENIIKSKGTATVKEIHIQKTDKVDKGQLLISFQ